MSSCINDLEFIVDIYCKMSTPISFFKDSVKRWLCMRHILNIHVNALIRECLQLNFKLRGIKSTLRD